MSLEEILGEAFKIGSDAKFNVCIDGECEEMTYIQLGTYLITNQAKIQYVSISLKF